MSSLEYWALIVAIAIVLAQIYAITRAVIELKRAQKRLAEMKRKYEIDYQPWTEEDEKLYVDIVEEKSDGLS